MNQAIRGLILPGLMTVLVGCAGTRPVGTNRGNGAGDYNGYAENLARVRPTYTPPVRIAPVTGTRPVNRPAEVRKPASVAVVPYVAPSPDEALHVTRQLDLVLDTIAQRNWSVRYVAGYRVQVYVGNERQQADAAKVLLYQNFPELNLYITFQQPAYKLKVGDFMRRMDAERYFASLKQLFPMAQLQADRIDIRRGLSIK